MIVSECIIIDVVRLSDRQQRFVITSNTGFVYQDRPGTPWFTTHIDTSHHIGTEILDLTHLHLVE